MTYFKNEVAEAAWGTSDKALSIFYLLAINNNKMIDNNII